MRSRFCMGLAALMVFVSPAIAWAGMGAPTLEDIPRLLTLTNMAKLRLDAISFFLVCILGIAWLIQRVMTPESIKNSSSHTITCGEVAGDFAAWGDPANVRDPVDGINKERNGFGSTDERGANYLMLDGSVRFLSSNTDRDVLTALATPEGD